jgi:hypothetical protein
MTDPLDGMLDDDLDELLDGTTGASTEPEDSPSMPEPVTDTGDGTDGSQQDRTAAGKEEAVQDGLEEVRMDPETVEGTGDYDHEQYDVLLDHGEGRAVLVEPGSAYGDDRYQVLGEEPDLEPDEYDEPVGVDPEYPSTLAEAGASVTAGTITAGFMTAEAGLEAFYNGLRGLVSLMD